MKLFEKRISAGWFARWLVNIMLFVLLSLLVISNTDFIMTHIYVTPQDFEKTSIYQRFGVVVVWKNPSDPKPSALIDHSLVALRRVEEKLGVLPSSLPERPDLEKFAAILKEDSRLPNTYSFLIKEGTEDAVRAALAQTEQFTDTGREGVRMLDIKRISSTEQEIHLAYESDERVFHSWYRVSGHTIKPLKSVRYWEAGFFLAPFGLMLWTLLCFVVSMGLSKILERILVEKTNFTL